MSPNNFIIFLACSSMVVLSSTELEPRLATPGTIKVRETCKRDSECIEHAFCRVQQTCLCDPYYSPSLDMATCHVTAGAPCADQAACSTMTNAECRQDVCTCKDDFMIDMNNSSNCIMRPRAAGDICQRNDDCKDSMQMSLCINNRCICYTDYRFVNETGTCLKMRGLYQPCKRNYDCFLDETRPNALECKNGECACRQANCSNGSPIHRPIFMVLATLAVGTTFRKFV